MQCATTHLTLFGALLEEFVKAIECSNAQLLSKEGFENVLKGDWWQSAAAMALWLLIATLFAINGMAHLADHRWKRKMNWNDTCFFVVTDQSDLYKEEHNFVYNAATNLWEQLTEIIPKRIGSFWRHPVDESCSSIIAKASKYSLAAQSRIVHEDVKEHLWRQGDWLQEEHMCQSRSAQSKLLQIADSGHLSFEKFFYTGGTVFWRTCHIFHALQPWCTLTQFSFTCPTVIRAQLLAAEISGALFVAALFYQASGMAVSMKSDSECTPANDFRAFLRDMLIGMISSFVSEWPIPFFAALHSRDFQYRQSWSEEQVQRKLRKWHRQDAILWCVTTCYNAFCMLFVAVFLANVSRSDHEDWMLAAGTSILDNLIISPFKYAFAIACLATLVRFLRPAAISHNARKLGLDGKQKWGLDTPKEQLLGTSFSEDPLELLSPSDNPQDLDDATEAPPVWGESSMAENQGDAVLKRSVSFGRRMMDLAAAGSNAAATPDNDAPVDADEANATAPTETEAAAQLDVAEQEKTGNSSSAAIVDVEGDGAGAAYQHAHEEVDLIIDRVGEQPGQSQSILPTSYADGVVRNYDPKSPWRGLIDMHPLADAAVYEGTHWSTFIRKPAAPSSSQNLQAPGFSVLRFRDHVLSIAGDATPRSENTTEDSVRGIFQREPGLTESQDRVEGLQHFQNKLSGSAESENSLGGGIHFFRDLLSGSALSRLSSGGSLQYQQAELEAPGGSSASRSLQPQVSRGRIFALGEDSRGQGSRSRIFALGEDPPEDEQQSQQPIARTIFQLGSRLFQDRWPPPRTAGPQGPDFGSAQRPDALLREPGGGEEQQPTEQRMTFPLGSRSVLGSKLPQDRWPSSHSAGPREPDFGSRKRPDALLPYGPGHTDASASAAPVDVPKEAEAKVSLQNADVHPSRTWWYSPDDGAQPGREHTSQAAASSSMAGYGDGDGRTPEMPEIPSVEFDAHDQKEIRTREILERLSKEARSDTGDLVMLDASEGQWMFSPEVAAQEWVSSQRVDYHALYDELAHVGQRESEEQPEYPIRDRQKNLVSL